MRQNETMRQEDKKGNETERDKKDKRQTETKWENKRTSDRM